MCGVEYELLRDCAEHPLDPFPHRAYADWLLDNRPEETLRITIHREVADWLEHGATRPTARE